MKKFNKTLVAVLLGLLMLVLGMDAQAYKLVFSNRYVETYGDATASYTLNAIDGISAKTVALAGQRGAAHISGTFTVVPDDGTLGEFPVRVIMSRTAAWTGYGFSSYQMKDGVVGTYMGGSSSRVTDNGLIMSIKTNHPYNFQLSATANPASFTTYASMKIVLVPEAVMTPVAISGIITEATFVAQEVAAIKAAAEAVLPPPPPPPPQVCTVVVAAPVVTTVEPVVCPVVVKEEDHDDEDNHESSSNAGTNVNEHANEHSSSDTGTNGNASDNAGKKP